MTINSTPAETTTPHLTVALVNGMSCGHCAGAVTEEVSAIPGVTDVSVNMANGEVTITSTEPLDEHALRSAIDEAGYELAGLPAVAH